MKQLIWLALLCVAFAAPTHAQEGMKGDAKAAPEQPGQPELVTLQTRYGPVQYYPHGVTVIASGFPWEAMFFGLRHWGGFQLGDKDVIFFENIQPGFSYGEAFFVVLKPGKDAEFIRVPIEPVSQSVKKVRQEGEVIYVDIKEDGKDGVTAVKFDFSKTPFGPRWSDS